MFLLLFLLQFGLSFSNDVNLESRKIFAVNCGGPEHIGSGNLRYSVDDGDIWSINSPDDESFSNVPSEERELYKTGRSAEEVFGYMIPVPFDGEYLLILKFREANFNQTGSRQFHVELNDLLLLNNFDIYRHAGFGAAYERRFPFTLVRGEMTIMDKKIYIGNMLRLLFHKGKAGEPWVNAVALLSGGLKGLPAKPANFDFREYNYTGYEMTYEDGWGFFTPAQCCQFCNNQDPVHFNPDTVRCSGLSSAGVFMTSTEYARVHSSYPEECCQYCGETPQDYFYMASTESTKPGMCRSFIEDKQFPSQCSLCEDLIRMMIKMDTKEVDVIKFELKDTCEKAEARHRLCKELIEEHGDTLIIAAHSNISTTAICTFMVKMCDSQDVAFPAKGLLPKKHKYNIVDHKDFRSPSELLNFPELTVKNLGELIGNTSSLEGRRRTIEFLAKYRIIRNEMACPIQECSRNMSLAEDGLEPRWRCEGCRRTGGAGSYTLSVKTGSFFEKDNLRLEEILKIMATWAADSGKNTKEEKSDKIFGDLCKKWMTRVTSTDRIGGSNKTIYIEEPFIYGVNPETPARLAVEFGSKKMALISLADESCESYKILKEFIQPGTTIISDYWSAACSRDVLQPHLKEDGFPSTTFLFRTRRFDDRISFSEVFAKPEKTPEHHFCYWFRVYHRNEKLVNHLLFEIEQQNLLEQ